MKHHTKKAARMVEVWKESSKLKETVRPGGVTLVIGCPGSGKTEVTTALASMAQADGCVVHLTNRSQSPTEDDKINRRLSQSIREASKGDLIIGREVFESDNTNFLQVGILAHKRNVTVLLEMQTADLGAARDVGCDVLLMRFTPYARHAESLSDLTPKEIAQINNFQPGEAILLSQRQKPKRVRVEMLRS